MSSDHEDEEYEDKKTEQPFEENKDELLEDLLGMKIIQKNIVQFSN